MYNGADHQKLLNRHSGDEDQAHDKFDEQPLSPLYTKSSNLLIAPVIGDMLSLW